MNYVWPYDLTQGSKILLEHIERFSYLLCTTNLKFLPRRLAKREHKVCENPPISQDFPIHHMIQDIDDRGFDQIIENSPVPILVEFWQPGCGHCQALLKELELIQAEGGERLQIFKMNVQENFLIPGELEIHSLPTLALYADGKFERFIGGIGKKTDLLAQLKSWIRPSN